MNWEILFQNNLIESVYRTLVAYKAYELRYFIENDWLFTVTAPTANATTSVAEVTVMDTPACLRAMPSLVSRLHLE